MKLMIHQTHHQTSDFKGVLKSLVNLFNQKNLENKEPEPTLHLFPENFLTGYPLKDLCLQKSFIDSYMKLIDDLNNLSLSYFDQRPEDVKGHSLLIGGLDYNFDKQGLPTQIKNVIFELTPGEKLKSVYTKRLLPNYDIYDERKYFAPGNELKIWNFQGKNILLLICEDMWPSHFYKVDPIQEAYELCKKENLSLDLVINLSASPFHLNKLEKRVIRAQEISKQLNAPMAYCNRVGGEDEILFDGGSFITDHHKILCQGKVFEKDCLVIDLDKSETKTPTTSQEKIDPPLSSKEKVNTWEWFFDPQLDKTATPTKLNGLSDEDCKVILQALKFGIQEYSEKCGLNNFIVALSGGIDSALVLTLMKLFLKEGQKVEALYMPGFYSANLSWELSSELCKNLDIPLYQLPIKFIHSTVRNSFRESFQSELEGLADENIQSRLRGSFLYARSNQTNAMVLNTSNKSELAVGYSTLYGDSVGAISPLGDIYKSEVFTIARYINKQYKDIIPEKIISRPPTAELREGQEDSQSLPPYERLDAILEGLLSYRMSPNELVNLGHDSKEVSKVFHLYQKSEFKRFQFCPIIKLKAKSFGFGYRIPLSHKRVE
ncbi:MAG: NAD(+) synthase [Halobacteriovoraceae bacterium]|nr:NAD(+) synthase [Halobacteriovoraceae bacterium]